MARSRQAFWRVGICEVMKSEDSKTKEIYIRRLQALGTNRLSKPLMGLEKRRTHHDVG
jgi:hypothetical protein